ncbi:YopX family protein [Clostridium perfringens]
MSRDIKFRVWDKTSDSMLYQDDFERVEIDTKNKMVTLIAEEESDKSHYVLDYEDGIEAEIMRYTGLKDKNGKEIYEGDIVSFYNDEEYRFKSTNALVIYDSAAFMLEHKKLGKEYLGEMDIENMCIKIIGNIYENPELLEREE